MSTLHRRMSWSTHIGMGERGPVANLREGEEKEKTEEVNYPQKQDKRNNVAHELPEPRPASPRSRREQETRELHASIVLLDASR